MVNTGLFTVLEEKCFWQRWIRKKLKQALIYCMWQRFVLN